MQIGPPREVYEFPNCRFSAQFLGSTNLVTGIVSATDDNETVIEAPDLGAPVRVTGSSATGEGAEVMVSIRPEKIQVRKDPPDAQQNAYKAWVEDIAFTGPNSSYHLRLRNGRTIIATTAADNSRGHGEFEPGQEVFVCWDASDGVLLDS